MIIFYNLNVNIVMFIEEYYIKNEYQRQSKCGKKHTYYRKKTMVKLRCDSCFTEFVRPKGSMDPKRLSNSYYHVCDKCDAKKFAQQKGVERRTVWNMKADSLIDISLL